MEKDTSTKARKEKELTASKRVWQFVKEDHPFENWLLLVLATVLLVISLYILIAAASDNNSFADTYFNISDSGWAIFDATWKVILISSLIVALSVGVIVFCLWPIFTPSFKELKNVKWTDKKTLFKNSLIVLLFIGFLTGLFYLFNFGLVPLYNLIFGA